MFSYLLLNIRIEFFSPLFHWAARGNFYYDYSKSVVAYDDPVCEGMQSSWNIGDDETITLRNK